MFHILWISILRFLYFNFFSASFCITFLSDGIAASINKQVFIIIIIIIIIISSVAVAHVRACYTTMFRLALRQLYAIGRPEMIMKNCAFSHNVATLLNPRSVTTVSHKYSLAVARHATVVVAVPSTVHSPTNYKINIYYFRWNLKTEIDSSH
jgi:hypothetical protein